MSVLWLFYRFLLKLRCFYFYFCYFLYFKILISLFLHFGSQLSILTVAKNLLLNLRYERPDEIRFLQHFELVTWFGTLSYCFGTMLFLYTFQNWYMKIPSFMMIPHLHILIRLISVFSEIFSFNPHDSKTLMCHELLSWNT